MTEIVSPAIDDLKKMVEEKGSKKAAAEALGIHPSYVGELINGTRPLTDTVLEKLGYEKVVVHVKADSLPSVLKAIRSAQAEAAPKLGAKK
jgi:predicted transcriptional regulator